MRSCLPHSMRISRTTLVHILTGLLVLATLFGVREVLGTPKPLVITLALTFLTWCIAQQLWPRRGECSTVRCIVQLLLPWALISSALLVGVYRVDRAGWIWYQLSGFNEAIAEERSTDIGMSVAEFVRRNSVFKLDPADPKRIIVPHGDHTIAQTVVVPQGSVLTIEPGTVLRMGAGCSLISYSPIVACGTASTPIVFTAKHHLLKWGVVGVVNSGQSRFEYVRFEHARQAVVNELDLPGGLSFIETEAEVRNCQFTNMFGKDALYVCRGHALIHDNRVEWAFKDGIDLDGASGEIRHNLLIDCDDEGIDLSDNTNVVVQHNTIRDRHGGRIGASHDLAPPLRKHFGKVFRRLNHETVVYHSVLSAPEGSRAQSTLPLGTRIVRAA